MKCVGQDQAQEGGSSGERTERTRGLLRGWKDKPDRPGRQRAARVPDGRSCSQRPWLGALSIGIWRTVRGSQFADAESLQKGGKRCWQWGRRGWAQVSDGLLEAETCPLSCGGAELCRGGERRSQ